MSDYKDYSGVHDDVSTSFSREELELLAALQSKIVVRFDLGTLAARRYIGGADNYVVLDGEYPDCDIESGFIAPESAESFRGLCECAKRGQLSGGCEVRVLIGGEYRWKHAQYALLNDENKGSRCVLITFSDEGTASERDLPFESWRASLVSLFAENASYVEFNLTEDTVERQTGLPSGSAGERIGCTMEEFVKYGTAELIYGEDEAAYTEFLNRDRLLSLYSRGVCEDTFEYRDRENGIQWFRVNVQMVRYSETDSIKAFVYFTNIHSQRGEMERLSSLAFLDSLTGLLNRDATERRISALLESAADDDLLSIFMIDLDNFKLVNDTLGHQQGDTALKKAASAIAETFRSSDIVGRLGGDEFMAFVRGDIGINTVKKKAEQLVNAIQFSFGAQNAVILTCSVGVAVCSGADGLDFSTLYQRADEALYLSKNAGKSRYCVVMAGDGAHSEPERPVTFSDSGTVQLQTLLKYMDGAIIITECKGDNLRVIYSSPSLFLSLGYTPERAGIRGERFFDLIHDEDRHRVISSIIETVNSGDLLDSVFRVYCNGGETGWRRMRVVRFPDDSGEAVKLIGVVSDVDELKQTALLRESLFDNFPTGAGLFELDGDKLRPIFVNRVFSEMTDADDPGCSALERALASVLLEAFERRPPVEGWSHKLYLHGDYRGHGRDNTWLSAECTVLYLRNDLPAVLVSICDITKEKLLEKQLRCAEQRYELAVLASGAYIWDIDLKSRTLRRVRSVQPSGERTLTSMNDVPNSIFETSIVPADSRDELARMYEDIYSGVEGGEYIMHCLYDDKDFWVRTSFSLIRDGDEVLFAVGISHIMPNVNKRLNSFDEEVRFSKSIEASLCCVVHLNLTKDKIEYLNTHSDIRFLNAEAGSIDSLSDILRALASDSEEQERLVDFMSRERLEELVRREKRAAVLHYKRLSANGTVRGAVNIIRLIQHPVSGDDYAFAYISESDRQIGDDLFSGLDNMERDSRSLLLTRDCFYETVRGLIESARESSLFSAMTVLEISGLAQISNDEGVERRDEVLLTIGRLCLLLVEGNCLQSLYDSSHIVFFRPGVESVETQHNNSIQCIRWLNSVLRAIYPDNNISLVCGFALESASHAGFESMLHKAQSACRTASRWVDSPLAVYFDQGGDAPDKLSDAQATDELEALKAQYRALEQRFQQQSNLLLASGYDQLTGLYTRQTFFRVVRERLDAFPNDEFSILICDINRFKVFNNLYGSEQGDQLLRSIAKRLRDSTLDDAIFSRLESDNFAALFRRTSFDPEKLCSAIAEWLDNYPVEFHLTASLGIYDIDDRSISVNLMCDRAQLVLRTIKNGYESRYAVYDESLRARLADEERLISDVSDALRREEFELYFQPQINYCDGSFIGAEALVRWNHPQKGLLTPSFFIPLFENNGLISILDEYVWDRCCRFIRKWHDRYDSFVPLSISVNISRLNIYNTSLCEKMTALVNKYDLSPSLLKLEITESAYIDNPALLIGVVDSLRAAGFTVEMDDFGSGYSSLNTLKDVHVDVLKLDIRFLEESEDRSRGGSILSSIIRMARWLDLPVIAEGVESKQQADYLKSIGCHYMQGFYFSKPLPAPEFEKLLGKPVDLMLSNRDYDEASVFWDASAQTALLFNSFVGGAAIIEYRDGSVEALRINDRYFSIIGTTREAYSDEQRHILDRFYANGKKVFTAMLRKAISSGEEADCEVMCKPHHEDGQPYWLHARSRLLSQSGECYLFYLTIENITGRVLLSQELKERASRIESLYNNMLSGVIRFSTDPEHRIIYINNTAASILKVRDLNHFHKKYKSGALELFHPNRSPERDDGATAMFDLDKRTNFSSSVRLHDGSICWLRGAVDLVQLDSGEAAVQCEFLDVTRERKQELDAELNRYSNALLDIFDEVFELDYSDMTVTVRRCQSSDNISSGDKIPLSEAVERWSSRYIYEQDIERFTEFWDSAHPLVRSGEKMLEYRYYNAERDVCWMSAVMIYISSSISLLCNIDITNVKHAESLSVENTELIKRQQEQESFRQLIDRFDSVVLEWDLINGTFTHTDTYSKYAMSGFDQLMVRRNSGSRSAIHPDDLPVLSRFFSSIEAHQPHSEALLRMQMIDGSFRWTRMAAEFISNASGQTVRVIALLTDMEASIKELLSRFGRS